MAWFSLLPPSFAFIETWLIKIFILLGLLSIGPWLLLIIYDAALYIFRVSTYEIPYVGGRARNRPRPRAPSLSERPSGNPRGFSLTLSGVPTAVDGEEEIMGSLKKRVDWTTPEGFGNKSVLDVN